MKDADLMAILNPEPLLEGRRTHKVWNEKIPTSDEFITVDTAFVADMRCFETGIKKGYWHIVERYSTEESAEMGHNKWVKEIKENPDMEIPDTLTDDY